MAKKQTPKPTATLKKQTVSYSKGSDGSTKTVYPKDTTSDGKVSQLTRYTTPMRKLKK
jgi:hypothetical protein